MSNLRRQHDEFVRDIRRGHLHASEAQRRYEPFTTSRGCGTFFCVDDNCADCANVRREAKESREVDALIRDLWDEQADYDREVARETKARERQESERRQEAAQRKDAEDRAAQRREESKPADKPTEDSDFETEAVAWLGIIGVSACGLGLAAWAIYRLATWIWGGITAAADFLWFFS